MPLIVDSLITDLITNFRIAKYCSLSHSAMLATLTLDSPGLWWRQRQRHGVDAGLAGVPVYLCVGGQRHSSPFERNWVSVSESCKTPQYNNIHRTAAPSLMSCVCSAREWNIHADIKTAMILKVEKICDNKNLFWSRFNHTLCVNYIEQDTLRCWAKHMKLLSNLPGPEG